MSTLIKMRGSVVMDKKKIAKITTPEGTESFKPVPHIELIKSLEKGFKAANIGIVNEEFSIAKKGKLMFGLMKLDYMGSKTKDGSFSVGIRQANDRSMSIQICAGYNVMVCDNLVFRGDMIALKRKHTSGIIVDEEVNRAIDSLKSHFGVLNLEMQEMKAKKLSDTDAKTFIHDAFVKEVFPITLYKDVSKAYFEPPHEEFKGRTMWSMHNAFTETLRGSSLCNKFYQTQKLGEFFGLTTKK